MLTIPAQFEMRQLYIPVLGILPVLAAVTSPWSGIAMGAVFSIAYLLSSVAILAGRPFFSAGTQWVLLVAVTATVVSVLDRLLQAGFYGLSLELGIYLPLLAMNGLLIGGLQEYVLPKPARTAVMTVCITIGTVFLVCAIVGLVRSLPAMPVLRNSAGLFLLVGLVLAMYNSVAVSLSRRLQN